MKRKIQTDEKAKVFLEIAKISKKIRAKSTNFNIGVDLEGYLQDAEEKHGLSAIELKYSLNMVMTYWNEGFGLDVEYFWEEIQKQKISLERKCPLSFAFRKERFLHVSQAMNIRKEWESVKNAGYLHKRYSNDEIEIMENIITKDENKKFEIIKKCLLKQKIASSYRKNYIEAVVYFRHCELFEKYFDTAEIQKINELMTTR